MNLLSMTAKYFLHGNGYTHMEMIQVFYRLKYGYYSCHFFLSFYTGSLLDGLLEDYSPGEYVASRLLTQNLESVCRVQIPADNQCVHFDKNTLKMHEPLSSLHHNK